MKKFGVFVNPEYIKRNPITNLLYPFFRNGAEFFSFEAQKQFLPGFVKVPGDDKLELDAILVFGGDGTILRAVPYSVKFNVPLLGINLGKLGFLTESTFTDFSKDIRNLFNDKYSIQSRMLMKVSVKRFNEVMFNGFALNDAVVYKGMVPKLIDVRILSNKRFILETRCDGLIAATPTGSTAYSLSAGGPILSPIMDAFIVTPLNPHILSVRPMVFPATDNLIFQIKRIHEKTLLQIDGRNVFSLLENDEVKIKSNPDRIKFVKLHNRTFYQILRKKLHMGKL